MARDAGPTREVRESADYGRAEAQVDYRLGLSVIKSRLCHQPSTAAHDTSAAQQVDNMVREDLITSAVSCK